VERRVRRLVALADTAPVGVAAAALPQGGALAFTTLFLLSLVALGAWAPLAVHTAAEAALQALK